MVKEEHKQSKITAGIKQIVLVRVTVRSVVSESELLKLELSLWDPVDQG